jgi:hypothetical protein
MDGTVHPDLASVVDECCVEDGVMAKGEDKEPAQEGEGGDVA